MTEAEWLVSDDPAAILRFVTMPDALDRRAGPSDRKLRLFAVACCRSVWRDLADARSRNAVGVAERFADGAATEEERHAAYGPTEGVLTARWGEGGPHYPADVIPDRMASWAVARSMSAATGTIVHCCRAHPVITPAAQAALLRCVVGSPFRPVALPPARCRFCGWLSQLYDECPNCKAKDNHPWQTDAVLALAGAAYGETRVTGECGRCKGAGGIPRGGAWGPQDCPDCRGTGTATDGLLDDFRLTLLADALEEAGCTEETLLRHLRGWEPCPCRVGADSHYRRHPNGLNLTRDCCVDGWRKMAGPHARGCFALDAVLGRE